MTTEKYTVYILLTGAAREFWFEKEHRKNFIHEFLSIPVLQWSRQNFGSGGDIQHKCTHQRLEKF